MKFPSPQWPPQHSCPGIGDAQRSHLPLVGLEPLFLPSSLVFGVKVPGGKAGCVSSRAQRELPPGPVSRKPAASGALSEALFPCLAS